MSDAYVHLNVGGKQYVTSKSTLTKCPDCMLAVICEDRWTPENSTENPIIIDRDGNMFRYILNYLRNESLFVFPDSLAEQKELYVEADYFALTELCDRINRLFLKPAGVRVTEGGLMGVATGQAVLMDVPKASQHKILAFYTRRINVKSTLFDPVTKNVAYCVGSVYMEEEGRLDHCPVHNPLDRKLNISYAYTEKDPFCPVHVGRDRNACCDLDERMLAALDSGTVEARVIRSVPGEWAIVCLTDDVFPIQRYALCVPKHWLVPKV